MNEIQESIARARAAQKDWIKHMKAEGWHGCPICKTVPIRKEEKMCAACYERLKKAGRFRKTARSDGIVQPSLDLQNKEPERKEPQSLKNLVDLETYRKK